MPQDAERAQVDGIPVFWAPAPGAFSAALVFRVGTADETLWDEIVLAERAPADTFVLHARDGRWLELHFSLLREGDRARRMMQDRLPAATVIPAGIVEATEALDALAADLRGVARVSGELAALPRELGADEQPEAVLVYRQGDEHGLLALTDQRLFRLFLGDPDGAGEAFQREAIRGARVRRRMLRASVLVIEAERELELVVDDAERAEAFAARLSPPFRP